MEDNLNDSLNTLKSTVASLKENFLRLYKYFEFLKKTPPKNSDDINASLKSMLHKVVFKYKNGQIKTYVLADIDELPSGNWDKTIEEISLAPFDDKGIIVNEK